MCKFETLAPPPPTPFKEQTPDIWPSQEFLRVENLIFDWVGWEVWTSSVKINLFESFYPVSAKLCSEENWKEPGALNLQNLGFPGAYYLYEKNKIC